MMLLELRSIHERAKGRPPSPGDRIFLTADGLAWGKPTNNAMRILKRTLRRAGIERVNERGERIDIHCLRHAACTRFLRHGVGLLATQMIMGHADKRMTSHTYQHLSVEDLHAAIAPLRPVRAPAAHLRVLPSRDPQSALRDHGASA